MPAEGTGSSRHSAGRRFFRIRPFRTIRARLLLWAVVTVLVLSTGIIAVTAFREMRQGRQRAVEHLELVAQFKQVEIEAWLDRLQGRLSAALDEQDTLLNSRAALKARQSSPQADIAIYSANVSSRFFYYIQRTGFFEEIFLLDIRGNRVASSGITQVGERHFERPYFQEGFRSSHVSLYAPIPDRVTVLASQPVFDERGEAIGVLVGYTGLGELEQIMLERLGLGSTGWTYLIAPDRTLLTRARPDETAPDAIASPGMDAVLATQDKYTGLDSDYRGVPVVGVYRWLSQLQVVLVVVQEQSEAFGAVYATLAINVVVAAGMASFSALFASLFVTRSIGNRLAKLTRTATEIAAGDLELLAEVEREDEIAALASAFNSMTMQLRGLVDGLEERVAELRLAQAALQESEARYRSLTDDVLDTSSVGIFILGADFRVVWVNRAMERFFGLRREQILGEDNRQLIRDRIKDVFEDKEAFVERVFATYDDNTYMERFECHVLADADRQERWLEHRSQPIRSGLYAGGRIEHYYDITERKRVEQAVRERAIRLELIARVGQSTTAILEPEELLQEAVRLVQEAFGYYNVSILLVDGEDIVFRATTLLLFQTHLMHKRLRIGRQGITGWVAESGEPLLVPDVRREPRYYEGAEGIETQSELAVPIQLKGTVIGVLDAQSVELDAFSQLDVFTLQTIADQLAVAIENASLYSDLQRQMDQLKRTQAQLVQSAKLAAVGQLAAGVAHELNNPLTSILGFAEILLKEVDEESPHREDLETIVSEGRRAREIILNLLDFSRQRKPHRELADVNRVLQQTLAVVQHQLQVSGVIVEKAYAQHIAPLLLDVGQMQQVFLNLITNALQAMHGGGRLVIDTRQVDDEVAVSIADTGLGISPEDQQHIFDPFYTTKATGTGLGLSVSLGIVQEHGGRITVESQEGGGSTFTVWLPAADESS